MSDLIASTKEVYASRDSLETKLKLRSEELERYIALNQSLLESVQSLEKQKEYLNAAFEEQAKQRKLLEEELLTLKHSNDRLHQDHEHLKNTHGIIENKHRMLNQELEQLSKQHENITSQHDEMSVRLQQMINMNSQLEQKLSSNETQYRSLMQE